MTSATLSTAAALLTPEQAAAHLDVEVQTLAQWRSSGRHSLPYLKIGRNVRYRKSDLDAWLEKRVRTSTD